MRWECSLVLPVLPRAWAPTGVCVSPAWSWPPALGLGGPASAPLLGGRPMFPGADPGVRKDDLGTKRCLHIPRLPVPWLPGSSTRIRLSQAPLPIWADFFQAAIRTPGRPSSSSRAPAAPGPPWGRAAKREAVAPWQHLCSSVAPHAGCSSLLAGKELNFESSSSGIVHTSLACN